MVYSNGLENRRPQGLVGSNPTPSATKMPPRKVDPLLFETYMAVIKNSAGSHAFRNFYATVNNKKIDLMRNGELSCAFFISNVLSAFNLMKGIQITVNRTVRDMKQSGWKRIKKPKIGSVLVWEPVDTGKRDIHRHIGFYLGKGKAVSNSAKKGIPVIHHWTFGTNKRKPKRRVEAIFWHRKLG